VFNDLKLGPSKVSGVVHDGTYIANALITPANEESGPWRSFVATYDASGIDETKTFENTDRGSIENFHDDPTIVIMPSLSTKPASADVRKEGVLDKARDKRTHVRMQIGQLCTKNDLK